MYDIEYQNHIDYHKMTATYHNHITIQDDEDEETVGSDGDESEKDEENVLKDSVNDDSSSDDERQSESGKIAVDFLMFSTTYLYENTYLLYLPKIMYIYLCFRSKNSRRIG